MHEGTPRPPSGPGGIFIRSADPEALNAWYQRHFGIGSHDAWWHAEAGPMVFTAFGADSTYFGDRPFMLNFRVDDLAALVTRLEADGVPVEMKPEWTGDGSYGTFARVRDPDGTEIELWQPPEELPD